MIIVGWLKPTAAQRFAYILALEVARLDEDALEVTKGEYAMMARSVGLNWSRCMLDADGRLAVITERGVVELVVA